MSGTKGRKLPTSADVSEQPKVVRYECWCSNKEVDPVEMVRYSDYEAIAARVQELEEKYEEAYDHMAMQDGMTVRAEKYNKLRAENTRLREALEYSRKMEMKDGNISGEFYQVVDEALKEKP